MSDKDATKPSSDGESVTTVAQRAGHKTAHTTLTTYAHAIAGEQKAMVERMDENYLRAAKKLVTHFVTHSDLQVANHLI